MRQATVSDYPESERTMNRFKRWSKTCRAARVKTVCVAMLLSAALWGISLWQGEKTAPYAGDIQIRYHGQGISRQTLEQITEAGLKQENKTFPEAAAWSVEYDVEARNPVLNFKQDVTCIMVRGEMDQIVKDRLAAGTYGFGDDDEGCVVSSKTAWELFGSTNVTGSWITVKGQRFVIRGVTAASYPMVILPAKRLETGFFSNISFSYSGQEGLEGQAEEMIMRFGLPRHGIRINGSMYYAVVRFFYTLPGWALLLSFGLFARRVKMGKKRLWNVFSFAVTAGIAAVLLWYGCRFPGDFIPSRWSDFSFYAEKFRQVRENLFDIATLPKTRWDVEMIRAFKTSVFCSAGAALLIITGNLLVSIDNHTFSHVFLKSKDKV